MTRSELRTQFVSDVLLPTVLCPGHRPALNLCLEFRDFLQARNYPRERATELADDELVPLIKAVETRMREWDEQGVPRPLYVTDQEAVFVTWAHKSFRKYAGRAEPIDRNYCEVLRYVGAATPKQFLVLSALWLRCLGCRRIFVSDGPHDGGVDVFGAISEMGLRSLVVLVQSKTSSSRITSDTITREHSKYRMLLDPSSPRFPLYKRALNVQANRDGMSAVYLLLANKTFDVGAQRAARTLGLLLRSPQQITQLLSTRYSLDKIEGIVTRTVPGLRADLTRNLWAALSW